jgi:hypothetical protein
LTAPAKDKKVDTAQADKKIIEKIDNLKATQPKVDKKVVDKKVIKINKPIEPVKVEKISKPVVPADKKAK